MRYIRLIGLCFVALMSVAAVSSTSHLRRLDLHPSACQKVSTVGSPTVTFTTNTMGPVGGDIGIMCPFEHPAFDDDLATQPYVNLSAKFKSGTSTLSACDFSMDDPLYASFGLGGIPAAGHSGVAIGGGYVFMPLLTTSGPAGMRLSCTLTNGSTIGSIEMDLDY